MAQIIIDWNARVVHIADDDGQVSTTWAVSAAEANKPNPVTRVDVGPWKPTATATPPAGTEKR